MEIGDVYQVELPPTDGREQIGLRPAIIVQSDKQNKALPTTLVIPLTSQLKAERFPSTLHIKAEEENGLKKDSVALIFQLRAIDQKRLKDRLGQLRKNQIDKLYDGIQDLLGGPKVTNYQE